MNLKLLLRIIRAHTRWTWHALLFAAFGHVFAANTITSATVNGTSSATVLPGATLTLSVTNTTSGGTSWGSTRWYVGTSAPGTWNCDAAPTPTISSNGSNMTTLEGTVALAAPTSTGTYNLYVQTSSSSSSCNSNLSAQFALAGAVIVANVPTVTTNAASSLTATSATLNGTVSSNNAATTVTFEYGASASYGSTVTATPSPLAASASSSAVTAALTGLTCNTTYHYRVKGANSMGTTNGSDQTFTPPCPPTATTSSATSVGATSATLNGSVSSNGGTTSTYFQYGLDTSYGTTTAASPSSLASTASNSAISLALTGLNCDTTYHYRAYANNSGGDGYGSDASFSTSACPVTLAKSASAAAAAVDSYVTFTIKATNPNGSTALSNVVITDAIPSSMTYSTSVTTMGTTSISGQTLTWTILSLPAGSSAQLTLVVKLTAKGTYTNTVSSPGATSASASVLVLPSAITHYRLDEPAGSWTGATGEVIDSGGNGLHGHRRQATTTTTNTVVPSPTIASQQSSVVGGFCNAGKFDGNAVVESASSPFFQFQQTLSASVWVYPTSYNSELSSILSNDVNYEFHLNSSGHVYWWWQASTLTSAAVIPLNQWTHIAITMDSTAANKRQRIYINGVQDTNTNNWTGTLSTNSCPFYIGGDISTGSGCALLTGRTFHGMIDEAKIYNYELSAAEVVADMTLGRQCSGTFDHIRIEHDGSATTCAPEIVTVKACMDAACGALYPGSVTVQLSPTGWTPADTVTFTGGVTSATLSNSVISTPSVTLGTVSVTPTPDSTTRCFNGTTETCTLTVPSTSCNFDAVEVGANPRTNLYTKLAGTSFSVDLLALTSGTNNINTAYTGTVTYDLVDVSSAACSSSSTALNTAQSYTFIAGNLGRKSVSMSSTAAVKSAQVRIKTGTTYACSTDKFSIRPQTLSISAQTSGGTALALSSSGASGIPMVKAGEAFTVNATSKTTAGVTTTGYDGTPTLNAALVTDFIDNTRTGLLSGTFSAASSSTGKATGTDFKYDEVGYATLATNAIRDITWVQNSGSGDWANSDCDTSTYSNTLNGSGKYGCLIGSSGTSMGRFIPDHFDTTVTPGIDNTGTTNDFTYSGQPFTVKVSAKNASGTVTKNFWGSYAEAVTLSDSNSASNNSATLGSLVNVATGNATIPVSSFTQAAAGEYSASVTYTFNNKQTAPITTTTPLKLHAASANVSSSSTEGTTAIRSGRLRIANAYGSELLAPRVEYRAEYWDGTRWLINAADSTSPLIAANFYTGGLTLNSLTGLTNGVGFITFNIAAAGSYDIAANLNTSGNDTSCNSTHGGTATSKKWLQGYWSGSCNGTAAWQQDPSARIRLGASKAPFIYMRERY